ncbi:unnamed protein product, partial [Pelagomonas calceolata]
SIHKLTAPNTPSTWRGDGVGADIHENPYAIDATLRRRWLLLLVKRLRVGDAPHVIRRQTSIGRVRREERLERRPVLLCVERPVLAVAAHPKEALRAVADSQVAERQHVGPLQVEYEVHVAGPRSDALDGTEPLAQFLDGRVAQKRVRQVPGRKRLTHGNNSSGLRAAQPAAAPRRLVEAVVALGTRQELRAVEAPRAELAEGPPPDRRRRRAGELLADHDPTQRAARRVLRDLLFEIRGRAVLVDDCLEPAAVGLGHVREAGGGPGRRMRLLGRRCCGSPALCDLAWRCWWGPLHECGSGGQECDGAAECRDSAGMFGNVSWALNRRVKACSVVAFTLFCDFCSESMSC